MLDRLARRLAGNESRRSLPPVARWSGVAILVFMTVWGFVRSLT